MKRRSPITTLASAAVAIVALGVAGKSEAERTAPDRLVVHLRWVKAYEKESWEDVRTGLEWSLSFLGAALPTGSLADAIERVDERRFRLDLSKVGFDRGALTALRVVIGALAASDEHRRTGAVDLGRFLVLTLHSSWHYYRITGAEPTFREFSRRYQSNRFERFPVVNSSVAHHDRMVRIRGCTEPRSMAFLAEEGTGSIAAGTFRTEYREVAALMPNGQFRFAIYDRLGRLAAASPASLSEAGKPSKCLWCHEINIQPLFRDTPDLVGYMSATTFGERVTGCTEVLNRHRRTLATEIDFSRTQDHTQSELLYISFMEPSARRLAGEWDLPVAAVEAALKGKPTHDHGEFPFLGRLYHRRDVEAHAPFRGVAVPDSVREPNEREPDLFRPPGRAAPRSRAP